MRLSRYFYGLLFCGMMSGAVGLRAEPVISRDEVEARAVLAKYAGEFEGLTDEQGKLAEAANMEAMESVSVETVRAFLAKEATLADVLKMFGRPFHVSLQEHEGVLWYRLPDRRDLRFWFQGNVIVGASYGAEHIKGIARVNQMSVGMKVATERTGSGDVMFTPQFQLNDERFDSLDAFKARLRKLPSGTVVVWQISCVMVSKDEPLRTEEQQKAFKQFCSEAGVRLIVRAAGCGTERSPCAILNRFPRLRRSGGGCRGGGGRLRWRCGLGGLVFWPSRFPRGGRCR